jgi:hypothetical protein
MASKMHYHVKMKAMRLITLLIVIGISNLAYAQVVRKGVKPIVRKKANPVAFYNTGQLNGKWQEVIRTKAGSPNALSFTDTLLMNINANNVEIRDGVSMNMKGNVSIDPPNTLNAAGDVYTIQSLSGNTLLLNDGDFIRRMQKTSRFYYEILGKDSIPVERFENPITADIKNLPGKWVIYRRQADPGKVLDENLFKSIQLNDFQAGEAIKGEVVIYNADITLSMPATYTINNGTMKIITDRKTWEFNIYKADGKELVFGNRDLMYYSKPL